MKALNSFYKSKKLYNLVDSPFNFSRIERDRACLLMNDKFYVSDYHSEIISGLLSIDEETAEVVCQKQKESREIVTFDIVLCKDSNEYLVVHHQDFLSDNLNLMLDYCAKNDYILAVYYTENLKVKSKLVII